MLVLPLVSWGTLKDWRLRTHILALHQQPWQRDADSTLKESAVLVHGWAASGAWDCNIL